MLKYRAAVVARIYAADNAGNGYRIGNAGSLGINEVGNAINTAATLNTENVAGIVIGKINGCNIPVYTVANLRRIADARIKTCFIFKYKIGMSDGCYRNEAVCTGIKNAKIYLCIYLSFLRRTKQVLINCNAVLRRVGQRTLSQVFIVNPSSF